MASRIRRYGSARTEHDDDDRGKSSAAAPKAGPDASPIPRVRTYGSPTTGPNPIGHSPAPDRGGPSSGPPSGPAPGAEQEIVVLCSRGTRGHVEQVADRLRAVGMAVPEGGVQEMLGMITGTIDPSRIDHIRAVPGVEFVRPSQTYRTL
ncbi:hypothetical protein [Tautonia sociabilis]|uniref:DAHP synthase ferredoxin-like domain-containing protein n=1 Tax=Tautonia sociabilis TaxID=2080755 RepID=A0A432MIH8_9BACT|nr:hypothetical protein [Tautonia sociabilis]RUL87174.1 hypothetical protein TsocGM_13940 [Tautonia sociabilis]